MTKLKINNDFDLLTTFDLALVSSAPTYG
jgi:hypothetical protein